MQSGLVMLMCTRRRMPARLAASNRTFALASACAKVKCGGLSNYPQLQPSGFGLPRKPTASSGEPASGQSSMSALAQTIVNWKSADLGAFEGQIIHQPCRIKNQSHYGTCELLSVY